MKKTELSDRFIALSDVLSYSYNLGYFSAGQRICIHQERASVLQAIDRINYSPAEIANPRYQVPSHIEHKIQQVIHDFL